MNITQKQLDELGRIADQANNLAAASQLPVKAEIHIIGLRSGLESIDKALRELYVHFSGEDPWGDDEE